jgi:hypothetical protein
MNGDSTIDWLVNMASTRFYQSSEVDVQDAVEATEATKTQQNNNWVQNLWKSWATAREEPLDFTTLDDNTFAPLLSKFLIEIRKRDGSEYPSETLYQIFCAVNRVR